VIFGVSGIVLGMAIGILAGKLKGAAQVSAIDQVNLSEVKIT
jgi:hypothetical protein